MKYIKALLILALVLSVISLPKPAAAQMYTYTSGYQVQNLADQLATITIDYYSQQTDTAGTNGGTQVKSVPDTITNLGSKTYFPIHTATGFTGSVVISSDTPLASIVNLVANNVGNASYIGSSQGSKVVSLPLLMKGNSGYTTWFSVQNTGAQNATVNVTYSDGKTAGPVTIKPNASYVFDQSKETHSLALFAGTLTSTENVVVVVVQEGNKFKTISATNGFDVNSGETQAFMPLINENNSNYITGAQIQNIGTQDTDIEVTYTPAVVKGIPQGTSCKETRTITKGSSVTFALNAFAQKAPSAASDCTNARFLGAGKITGNSAAQPVVVIVNQMTNTTSPIAGAYGSFAPKQVTSKLVLPLIHDRNSGWWTGFNLQNVGADPVDVTCTFTNTSYKVTGTLAAGEVLSDIQQGKIANGYHGSGTCVATGTGETKISAVVNEIAPGKGDTLLVYEGINVAP